MNLKCIICGKVTEIDEDHDKYEYYCFTNKTTHICQLCEAKVLHEAKGETKADRKPM